jgi:DNA-binding CsgD family transcriptional regulator
LQLEKQNDILHKRIEDLVKQLSGAYCDIENRENQLLIRNKQLEKTNKELLEANNALKVLAKNLDGIKKNTEEKLLNDIYSFIYPLLSKLKKADTKIAKSRLIDNLQFKIDELCQTLYNGNGISFRKSLTASEIKVAALIKDGLSSVEIAKDLKISVATVKTHRKNIRRKLKIQNFRINLANYLKLNWHNRIY